MSYIPPATGSTVRMTIEGVIEFADETTTLFEGGVQVETRNESFGKDGVSYEVFLEQPRHGAVGIYYDYVSQRSVVLYRRNTDVTLCGWFTADGHKVPSASVRPLSLEQYGELLFSQDKDPNVSTQEAVGDQFDN